MYKSKNIKTNKTNKTIDIDKVNKNVKKNSFVPKNNGISEKDEWFNDISDTSKDCDVLFDQSDFVEPTDINTDISDISDLSDISGLSIKNAEDKITTQAFNVDYPLINELFNIEKDFVIPKDVIISNNNEIEKDTTVSTAKNILKQIDLLFIEMSNLSKTGFVNDNNTDLPILRWFITEYKMPIRITKGFSIYLNVLFFNFIMIFLYNLVVSIKTECVDKFESNDIKIHTDFLVDLNNTSKRILRMINPNIKNRMSNKGLSIILNTLIGFDTEWSHISTGDLKNKLLSIQLAGTTGLVLKIPVVLEYNKSDFKIASTMNRYEKKMCDYLHNSIASMISNIRSKLYKENDLLLESFLNKLEQMDFHSTNSIGDYEVFMLKNSDVKQLIKYPKEYSSTELVNDCESLNSGEHEKALFYIIGLLNEVSGVEMSDRLSNSIKINTEKPLSRITYRHGESRLSISLNRVTYICAHESAADLSMLSDFDTFKDNLDIVHRSFVTLSKPILLKDYKSKIHFRDTILLAPIGAKSLKDIGNIYGGEFKKIEIDPSYIKRMDLLLTENPELFEKYAKQDAVVTLKHASTMEDFYLSLSKLGVPLTLSSVGKSYVLKEWEKVHFKGYQYGDDLNLSTLITPKGARSAPVSTYIVPFIAGYRGGRNESFMYGVENCLAIQKIWYDYDLISCYTTVMSLLGVPDYNKAGYLFNSTVLKMEDRKLLTNYIILDVTFEFKKGTKYPSIPTRVDNDVDIYPLKGRSTITGPEYLVAKAMGCKLFVKSGVIIPFVHLESGYDSKKNKVKEVKEVAVVNEVAKEIEVRKNEESLSDVSKESLSKITDLPNSSWSNYKTPYRDIVTKLQQKRREFEKGTFGNYMYKEIGNSIYGHIAMGIGGKKTFDVKTKSFVKVEGSVLSSPVLASYITGFVRALIGECLNNIHRLGGEAASVTTDGFMTTIKDLEDKILALEDESTKICLHLYRYARGLLTYREETGLFDNRGLEVKNVERNLILSCKTRVQFGSTDGGISAATGFQTSKLEKDFIIDYFSSIINSVDRDKRIEYIQTSLRSASDIYNNGGNVVLVYKDKSFSLEYDNKRCIIENNSSSLLDTKPWDNVISYRKIRILKSSVINPVYVKGLSTGQSKVYKTHLETCVRGFIKACLAKDIWNRYGIPIDQFNSYKSIIDFVKSIGNTDFIKISKSSISNLKHRNSIARTVPRTDENEAFMKVVKERIPEFNTDLFFKELSDEARKARKALKDLAAQETKLLK